MNGPGVVEACPWVRTPWPLQLVVRVQELLQLRERGDGLPGGLVGTTTVNEPCRGFGRFDADTVHLTT
jgi:hypothetical protein